MDQHHSTTSATFSAPDDDCYTLPTGECIAVPCRLHDGPTLGRYQDLPAPVGRSKAPSDADLDVIRRPWVPRRTAYEDAKITLARFAARWNPILDLDTIHLGERVATWRDDPAVVAQEIRRADAVRRARPRPGRRRIRVSISERDLELSEMRDEEVERGEDRWDFTAIDGRVRVAEYHDLHAHLSPIPGDTDGAPTVEWNGSTWTPQALSDRWNRFEWNDHYFDGHRIPWHARVGRIATGRFVYFPDAVMATSVTKRYVRHVVDHDVDVFPETYDGPSQPDEHNPEVHHPIVAQHAYTVWWRESMGTETLVKPDGETRFRKPRPGERIAGVRQFKARVWNYVGKITFQTRAEALAFAARFEAKARLEADLLRDAERSMQDRSPVVPWDTDEFPYEPQVLTSMHDGRDDD